jgi:hypothetical protein
MVGDRKVTHSDFAALRHDVLKRFKGASLYKAVWDALHKTRTKGCVTIPASGSRRPYFYIGERERHPIWLKSHLRHKNIQMVGGRKAAGAGIMEFIFEI